VTSSATGLQPATPRSDRLGHRAAVRRGHGPTDPSSSWSSTCQSIGQRVKTTRPIRAPTTTWPTLAHPKTNESGTSELITERLTDAEPRSTSVLCVTWPIPVEVPSNVLADLLNDDHCQLHHITWWRHSGQTDLGNLTHPQCHLSPNVLPPRPTSFGPPSPKGVGGTQPRRRRGWECGCMSTKRQARYQLRSRMIHHDADSV
jgi:hypothetical protein